MNTLRPVHWFLIVHVLVSVVTSVVVIQTEMMWPMAIQGLFMLLGASFLVYREKGWASIKALHKLTISANHPVKYWLAALSLAGVGVLAMAVYGAIAKPDGLAFVPAISPMVFGLLFGVWLEEMNWRGYALPRLVELHGTIKASLILSVFWSLWHLPYFLLAAPSAVLFRGDFSLDLAGS